MPEKKNILPLLAIAFVVAVVCTGVFYGLFVGKLRGSASAASPVIVVAARVVPRGTVIQPSDVREITTSTNVPKGAYLKSSDVTGQTAVSALKEGEPLTRSNLASPTSGAGAALSIPAGMRAVSVRTGETPGVSGLLRPGHRVDVQFVGNRANSNPPEPELRTILQDVEVLAVNPQQDGASRAGVVVLTLLVKPEEADLLGLADTNSRLRLVLRNPADHQSSNLSNVSAAALMRLAAGSPPAPVHALANVTLGPISAVRNLEEPRQVALSVQIVGAGLSALTVLTAGVSPPDTLQVVPVPASVDLASLSTRWSDEHQWQVLSASRLVTASGHEVSIQATAQNEHPDSSGVTLQLRPSFLGAGQLRLRIQPQFSLAQAAGSWKHRIASELDVPPGQSVLVTGFPSAGAASLIDSLFPLAGGQQRQQQLVVLVTPKSVQSARTPAPAPGE